MDYLAYEKIYAIRLNTAAIQVDKRFFRSHSGGKGTADILALIPLYTRHDIPGMPKACQGQRSRDARGSVFLPVWIEAKAGKGIQSKFQKDFEEHVRSLGHMYILARSVDDVRGWVCVESGL